MGKCILCASVRLDLMVKISDKAYKAYDFNGNEDIIPASMVFGQDYEVQKSEAWWIAEWILEKKSIIWSGKKTAWFNKETGKMVPQISIEKHVPEKRAALDSNEIDELKK